MPDELPNFCRSTLSQSMTTTCVTMTAPYATSAAPRRWARDIRDAISPHKPSAKERGSRGRGAANDSGSRVTRGAPFSPHARADAAVHNQQRARHVARSLRSQERCTDTRSPRRVRNAATRASRATISFTFGFGHTRGAAPSVSMGPGAMQFTRMPCSAPFAGMRDRQVDDARFRRAIGQHRRASHARPRSTRC